MLCKSVVDHIIRVRMKEFMGTKLKWTHKDLHDAVLSAGIGVPTRPSLLNYFTALRLQFGDSKVGFFASGASEPYEKNGIRMFCNVLRGQVLSLVVR